MSTTRTEPEKSVPPDASGQSASTSSDSRRSGDGRYRSRRVRWQWNQKLLLISLGLVSFVALVAAASYFYHSGTAASTFMLRAEAAAEQGDFSEQAKWLSRYSLLKPDDLDAVVEMAIAADTAADKAERAQAYQAIDAARNQLNAAIAQLGGTDPEIESDLRNRLIERLLQLGGPWFREAERQVMELQAEPGNPQATAWLARALIGQVNDDRYSEQDANKYSRSEKPWRWLSHQKPGDVLARAVELNPQDLDLIASFLSDFRSRPELFSKAKSRGDADLATASDRKHQRLIDQSLATLRDNEDSRSKLIYFSYLLDENADDEVIAELMEAAEVAASRLAERARQMEASDQEDELIGIAQPDYYWDYLLVIEAAGRIGETSPALAESYYDQLMDLQLAAIPGTLAENVFLAAGRLQQLSGNVDRAIEIWERGVETVNPDSIELLGSIATSRFAANQEATGNEDAEPVDAKSSPKDLAMSLETFRQAIDAESDRLMRASKSEMSSAARREAAGRLDVARWRLNVMLADQAVRDDRRDEAIDRLNEALTATVEIDDRARVPVAQQLATLHLANGAWDQAGAVLDRAIEFAPDDRALRAQAAEVWQRAGNVSKAMEMWRVAGEADSPALRLAAAEADYNYQVTLPPDRRDFSGVRAKIRDIKASLSDPSSVSTEQRRARDRIEQTVELLAMSLPATGSEIEEHLKSTEFVQRLTTFAAKNADDASIQAYAARRLATAGDDAGAEQALERLGAIAGANSSEVTVARARIEAAAGDEEAAAERLLDFAVSDADQATAVLRLAAAFASSAGNNELAYRALLELPEDSRNVTTLFQFAALASRLPEQSPYTSEKGLTPDELAADWQTQLRNAEGDRGTYWRLMKVTELIDELQSEPDQVDRNDPRLAEARKQIRQILSWRPGWGDAISLQGYLSAIEGRRERAVDQLRRGITAGDQRLSTRMLLIRQLESLGRDGEAEQEIQLAVRSTDREFDRYSQAQIGLALKQGDLSRGISFAEAEVEAAPDDYLTHVLLCRTATAAAGSATDDEQRDQYLAKADAAIEKAAELAEQDETTIFSARLQLAVAKSSEQAVRDEIEAITNSELSEYDRLALQSRAHIGLQEWEVAKGLLERAYKLQPSLQIQLLRAELYRRLGETDQEIAALQEARQRNPDNAALRNRLAASLAARDGENIDWDELANLLVVDGVNSSNRFVYAVLMVGQGSVQQKVQGMDMLREIMQEQNNYSDPAARVLAGALRSRLRDSTASSEERTRQLWESEIRAIYDRLIERASPLAVDLYNYASFLLNRDQPDDLPKVASLLNRLKSDSSASMYALEVAVRYEIKTSGKDAAPRVIETWAQELTGSGSLEDVTIASVAGTSLLKLGFGDEGLDWIESAYRQDPKTLANYVVALNRLGRIEDGLEVCKQHFAEYGDELSSTLLVETLVAGDVRQSVRPENETLVQETLRRHPNHIPLLESVATLRLMQERYAEAVEVYRKIRAMDPRRLRTLNNLAMALSEIPGRAIEGLDPINQAIDLAGEVPELLDTKGVVLFQAGRPREAERVFRQAMVDSEEPRYHFHLILSLLAQDKEDEAKREWQKLDLENLDPNGLTPAERLQLEQLKEVYGE